MSNPTIDLGLSDKNSGGGCACCSTPAQTVADTASAPASLIETTVAVTGMTCGHCVSSITEELTALDGVESVNVQLNVGGASTVTVASSSALDSAAIRAAVGEAGYALADA
ncbi:copper chaperone CopZ [Homoserinimonas aerilata]|uniref:Copper chaperone CopZ n=1 Tax=Homoserinimonas aerilata TaxID=1162970 RepID=A0A542YJC4_9MICO|nr:cation transporter [Homoserinimonas aerilata]TQL48215.1 copper chaperone CopZ [Homoserinimonas aerilata]